MNNNVEYEETKPERREKKLRKKRERVPQHGKNLANIPGRHSQTTNTPPR